MRLGGRLSGRCRRALATSTSAARVFTSRGITLDSDTATGRLGTSEQLTAGFVVGPGVFICPSVNQEAPSSGAAAYIDYIMLRGYLSSP
jgi:hypothetical protein